MPLTLGPEALSLNPALNPRPHTLSPKPAKLKATAPTAEIKGPEGEGTHEDAKPESGETEKEEVWGFSGFPRSTGTFKGVT